MHASKCIARVSVRAFIRSLIRQQAEDARLAREVKHSACAKSDQLRISSRGTVVPSAKSYRHKFRPPDIVLAKGNGEQVGAINAEALDCQYQNYRVDRERLFRHFVNLYAFDMTEEKQAGVDKADRELSELDARPQFDGIRVSSDFDKAIMAFARWYQSGCPRDECNPEQEEHREETSQGRHDLPPRTRVEISENSLPAHTGAPNRSQTYRHAFGPPNTDLRQRRGYGLKNAIALDYQYQNYLTDQARLFRHFVNMYACDQAGEPQAGVDRSYDELFGPDRLDADPKFDGIRNSADLNEALREFRRWESLGSPRDIWHPSQPDDDRPPDPEVSDRSNTLDALNVAQQEAVTARDRNILVLAGPGTGKTRVLTHRIAWLIDQGLASSDEILAVTFTRKAANEMRRRLNNLTDRDTPSWIGTFHSIGKRILDKHPNEVGLHHEFKVADIGEQRRVLRKTLRKLGRRVDQEDVRNLIDEFARHKERGENPPSPSFRDVYVTYNEMLREENLVDFGDMILLTRKLFDTHQAVRDLYAEKFSYVLIDEFQDTSPFQYGWLKMLSSGSNIFFVVGDDDQSIYEFRDADPRIMRMYEEEFRAKTIRLKMNYRSQPSIVCAANRLISHNTNRMSKEIRSTVARGECVRLMTLNDGWHEANYVSRVVESLLRQNRESIGVIYRTNAQSYPFEHRMIRSRIPHHVLGGKPYSAREEVKIAIAYLQLAMDPDDGKSFRVAVRIPPRRISEEVIETILNARDGTWAGILMVSRVDQKVKEFRDLLEGLGNRFANRASPREMVELMLDQTGLREHYRRHGRVECAENLDELVTAAIQYEEENKVGATLPGFIRDLCLDTGARPGRGTGVTLMTAHAAKGLEFEVVFVTGLEEDIFPHYNALMDQQEEEERRLMYVSITRAKRVLYLTHAHRRLLSRQVRTQRRSRFIDECL